MAQSRRWCFTLNNPTDEQRAHIQNLFNSDEVHYGVFGNETGVSGTPHLQGFVIFHTNRRFNAARASLPGCHVERTRGTSAQAAEYCKKDGNFVESGTIPAEAGRRTDLERYIQWADDFELANGRPASSPEIAREQPVAYIRYPRFTQALEHRVRRAVFEFPPARDWQQALANELDGPADDRTVKFFVDPTGGNGKTWFIRWYHQTHPETCQVLGIGKRDDIAYMINTRFRVFLINVPRGGMEFLQYTILESLKDKYVVSTKYQSRVKEFRHNNHVVIFCNEHPKMEAMSDDRYDITEF